MAEDKRSVIKIDNFNQGGLADSRWSGVNSSLYKMTGLDPHTLPGLLKVEQKLTKISSTTIDAFCKERVVSSNGMVYFFSSTSGKIWQVNPSNDAVTLIYTTSPAAGNAGCLGAIEYNGYIYWATQSRLHRISASGNTSSANWTTNAAPNWQTFLNTDDKFHPMIVQNMVLYIGDANEIAQVDDATFTGDVLTIESSHRIKSLGRISTDILIGTWSSDAITQTEILRWNTYSVSFDVSDTIPEVGINAFIPSDNFVLVQAGLAGNFYYYNGEQLELFKKIPGEYTPSKYGLVHPSSVGNLSGKMLIGFSNGAGNPADQGVYRFARHDRKYPFILDFAYPISERSTGNLVTTGIEIGGIAVSGFNVYVAWKNGTTYGVDKVDYSNKLENAYFETRIMFFDREKLSTMSEFSINYQSMPDDCSLTLYYDKNYAGYVDLGATKDTQRLTVASDKNIEASVLSTKVAFTVDGNDAPVIEGGKIELL